MGKVKELDREKQEAVRAALELGYPTKFVKAILLAKNKEQISQQLIAARHSADYETEQSIRNHLMMEGIEIPQMRSTIGQNFID